MCCGLLFENYYLNCLYLKLKEFSFQSEFSFNFFFLLSNLCYTIQSCLYWSCTKCLLVCILNFCSFGALFIYLFKFFYFTFHFHFIALHWISLLSSPYPWLMHDSTNSYCDIWFWPCSGNQFKNLVLLQVCLVVMQKLHVCPVLCVSFDLPLRFFQGRGKEKMHNKCLFLPEWFVYLLVLKLEQWKEL